MFIWIAGNTGAGKTVLAKSLVTWLTDDDWCKAPPIHLDGDELRKILKNDDFSFFGRAVQNLMVGHLGEALHNQGFDVIVSSICPFSHIRQQIAEMGAKFVIIEGGAPDSPEHPFQAKASDEEAVVIGRDALPMNSSGLISQDAVVALLRSLRVDHD